jgi:hypothetical protein
MQIVRIAVEDDLPEVPTFVRAIFIMSRAE